MKDFEELEGTGRNEIYMYKNETKTRSGWIEKFH